MRNRFRDVIVAATTALVIAGVSLTVSRTSGQGPASGQFARTADGRPDLNGIWQALNTANEDLLAHHARPAIATVKGPIDEIPAPPVLALGAWGAVPAGLGVVEGNEIPYKPEALKKKQENFEHSLTRDPAGKCYLPGVPRATYMPFPFQIVQSTNEIMMLYEFAGGTRTIHMGKVEPAPLNSWMGHSVGRWDGNSLVVTVTDLMETTWFDRAGNHHSDQLRVTERYTPIDRDHLQYEATIEDPQVFSRPWKISMPLYRRVERQAQLLEFKCVEFVEELMYGHLRKEQLAKRWEADLGDFGGRLTIDITRQPSAATR